MLAYAVKWSTIFVYLYTFQIPDIVRSNKKDTKKTRKVAPTVWHKIPKIPTILIVPVDIGSLKIPLIILTAPTNSFCSKNNQGHLEQRQHEIVQMSHKTRTNLANNPSNQIKHGASPLSAIWSFRHSTCSESFLFMLCSLFKPVVNKQVNSCSALNHVLFSFLFWLHDSVVYRNRYVNNIIYKQYFFFNITGEW